MTTAHSPAPWSIDRGQLRDRDGNALAQVPIFPDGIGGPEDLANGQLLAAAPDLAGALEALFAGVNAGKTRETLAQEGVTLAARLALFKAGGPFAAPNPDRLPMLTPQEALRGAWGVVGMLGKADPMTFDHARAAGLLDAMLSDLAAWLGVDPQEVTP